MCLVLVAHRVHPRYPLVLAANRDEFYERPTAPLQVWPDAPEIVAGRDLRGGGTWLGVLEDSPNMDLAKDFVRFATLDEEFLTNWATGVYTNEYMKAIDPEFPGDQQQAAGDFVSSQVVVEKIIPSFDDSELSAFLAGQNSYGGFAEAAPTVNAKLMTGSDDAIQRALGDPLNQYLNDEISKEEMWATWKDSLRVEFPELIIK